MLGKAGDLSYGKVLVGAICLSRKLRAKLDRDQPMVGLWLPPGAPAALANIALAFLGKVAVNLNYTTSPAVVQSSIGQCKIRQVLTSKRFTERVPLDPGPGVELIFLEDLIAQITRGQKIRAFLSVLLLPRFILDRWLLGLRHHDPTTWPP